MPRVEIVAHKLLWLQAARMLFPTQHLRRWCFDVELLYLAQRQRIPIAEVQTANLCFG